MYVYMYTYVCIYACMHAFIVISVYICLRRTEPRGLLMTSCVRRAAKATMRTRSSSATRAQACVCLSVYLMISLSLSLHSSTYVCVSVCVLSATRAQARVGTKPSAPCSRTTLMAPAKVVTALLGPRDSSRLCVWVYRCTPRRRACCACHGSNLC